MDPRRTTIVGGAALVVIAGVAAANLALWSPLEDPDAPQIAHSAPPVDHPERGAVATLASVPETPRLARPPRFDTRRRVALRPVEASSDRDAEPPSELPGIDAAVPLTAPAELSDSEILGVIDDELPDASRMERDVWLEELRDVPPEMMRRMLRLWREEHAATPDGGLVHEFRANGPVEIPGHAEVFALDADFDRDQLIAQLGLSLEAIGRARDVILNNVANAGTVGFKRSEVLFGECGVYEQRICCEDGQGVRVTAAFRHSAGEGADVADIRLDTSPGRLQRTGRPLDVAIAGTGFLQVRRGDELLLTRAGRLTRDADGRLVVTAPLGPCALDPPVIVPDEAADVHIAPDGVVTIRLAGQECPFEAGRILVARCADATTLVPRGGSLFAATAASGPPQPGTAGSDGLGKLRQGVLERSNVDLDREAAAFRALQARIDVFSQIVSGAIPFASARPLNIVAAPPDDGELDDPGLEHAPRLIDEYLRTRQTDQEGPELR